MLTAHWSSGAPAMIDIQPDNLGGERTDERNCIHDTQSSRADGRPILGLTFFLSSLVSALSSSWLTLTIDACAPLLGLLRRQLDNSQDKTIGQTKTIPQFLDCADQSRIETSSNWDRVALIPRPDQQNDNNGRQTRQRWPRCDDRPILPMLTMAAS